MKRNPRDPEWNTTWAYTFGILFARIIRPALRRVRAKVYTLLGRGHVSKATRLAETALDVSEWFYARDSVLTLEQLFDVAWCRFHANETDEAERLLLHASDLNARNSLHGRPGIAANIWYALGAIARRRYTFDSAVSYTARSLAIEEKNRHPNPKYIAAHEAAIGEAQFMLGAFERAEAHLRRALDLGKPTGIRRAAIVLFLGRTLTALGKLSEAKPLVDEFLALTRAYPRSAEDDAGGGLVALADIARLSGDSSANELYAEAVRTIARAAPEYWDRLGFALGVVVVDWKRDDPACDSSELLRRALAVDDVLYGNDWKAVAKSLDDAGSTIEKHVKDGSAFAFFRASLDVAERACESDSKELLPRIERLSTRLRLAKRDAEAIRLIERSIAILAANGDETSAEVALCYNRLAHASIGADRQSEAEDAARRSLAIGERLPDENPKELAAHQSTLAATLELRTAYAEALDIRERSLAVARSIENNDEQVARLEEKRSALLRRFLK